MQNTLFQWGILKWALCLKKCLKKPYTIEDTVHLAMYNLHIYKVGQVWHCLLPR